MRDNVIERVGTTAELTRAATDRVLDLLGHVVMPVMVNIHDHMYQNLTRGGAAILGRDDIGQIAPGMSADFIAVRLNQLGLSGTQRDPLAALVMCGPFKVDYSFINGVEIIGKGEFHGLDIDALLADHALTMARIYQA